MIEFHHIADGFTFVAVFTGIGTLICGIWAGVSIEDRKDYASSVAVLAVSLTILFLFSGFMGLATR